MRIIILRTKNGQEYNTQFRGQSAEVIGVEKIEIGYLQNFAGYLVQFEYSKYKTFIPASEASIIVLDDEEKEK